jgi:hypothetical protein
MPAAAAGTPGGSLVVPFGTAPSSPSNGAIWATTAGLYFQSNSGVIGPLNGATAGSGCVPVGSAGSFLLDSGAGGCTDSASPLAFSKGGLGFNSGGTAGLEIYFSATNTPSTFEPIGSYLFTSPSNLTLANGTTVLEPNFAWANGASQSGVITSVDIDNVAATGAFTVGILHGATIGGATAVTCGGGSTIAATSSQVNSTCSANTTLNAGDVIEVQITGVSGSPSGYVKLNYAHTAQ